MLNKLKTFFKQELDIKENESSEQQLQRACAALLIEVTRADFEKTQEEKDKVASLLQSKFNLSETQLQALIAQVEENEADTTSVYPFTSLIKEQYDYEQRVNVIRLMWKVAYADGELDRFEDDVIRKTADLLYVRHSDFIQAKLEQAP
uniref:tellurite resistance TerB family protein n=1 Tax=Ningiella ruwaisensis TaxID=2364274 RepID=UPI0010A069E2|nr:TerB family tellurite resistance protein [Ningiella ruwaisensis]